jgi:hypothetical protein
VILLACTAASLWLVALIRQQFGLLAYGRSAMAVVRALEKKRSDKGTYWRVTYEWQLLNGATRKGRYNHRRRPPPEIGTQIPIVYDPDQPWRNCRYPLPLVRIVR